MVQSKKIKNLQDLTNNLVQNYEALKNGKITIDEAKAACNSAGAITKALKLQLNYNSFTKSDKKIDFMEY